MYQDVTKLWVGACWLGMMVGIGLGLSKALGGTFVAAPWWAWALLVGVADCGVSVALDFMEVQKLLIPTEFKLLEKTVHED
jgi:hypothetical protein